MKKIPWLIWKNLPWVFVVGILLINLKLHTGPSLRDGEATRRDVARQLAYLERQIHEKDLGR